MAVKLPTKSAGIWLIGDSLGVGLLKPLRKLAAADGVTLDGSPVGGTAVYQWTQGSKYVANIDAALKWPAGTFLVSLGTNDAAGKVAPDIRPLVTHLRSNGAKVIWIGPPSTNVEFAPKTIASIKAQCSELDVPYIDSRALKIQKAPGDGIHPSGAGYASWASWLWPKIRGSNEIPTVAWVVLGAIATIVAALAAHSIASRRRLNPFTPTWRDFIKGEWWIVPGEEAQFADRDVGEAGHRELALEAMFDNDVLVDGLLEAGVIDEEQAEEARENGAAYTIQTGQSLGLWKPSPWVLKVLTAAFVDPPLKSKFGKAALARQAEHDPERAYMEHWGAIRAAGRTFQMHKVTSERIRAIQDFLLGLFEEGGDVEPDKSSIEIEDFDHDMVTIPIAEFLAMKHPRDVWGR